MWTYTGGWGGAHFQGSSKSELLGPVEVNLEKIFRNFPSKMKKKLYIFLYFSRIQDIIMFTKTKDGIQLLDLLLTDYQRIDILGVTNLENWL